MKKMKTKRGFDKDFRKVLTVWREEREFIPGFETVFKMNDDDGSAP